jgi:hypothetical protein
LYISVEVVVCWLMGLMLTSMLAPMTKSTGAVSPTPLEAESMMPVSILGLA